MKNTLEKIVLIVVIVEMMLQIISYGRFLQARYAQKYNKVIVNWYTKENANAWWSMEMPQLIPKYNALLGFKFQDIHTPHINIDSSGIRHTTHNPPPDSSTKSIFFFGGSAMAGFAVKDEETIPSYVANSMNTPIFRYRFTNYGQIRYNVNQELMLLVLQLKNGNIPDMVIFYDGFNDAVLTLKTSKENRLNDIVSEHEHAQKMGSLSTIFSSQIENKSLINIEVLTATASFISKYVKIIHYPIQIALRVYNAAFTGDMPRKTPQQVPEEMIQKTINNYVNNATTIKALSQQYKFKYILLWQPLPQYKKLTKQEVSDTEIPYYPDDKILIEKITSGIHAQQIDHFVDLSDVFDAHPDTSIFMDSIHISPEGNRIVSKKISELIEEEFTR